MTLEDLNMHLDLLEKRAKAQEILMSLREAAYPGVSQITNMPRVPGVKDKVGDLAAEIADLTDHIDALTAEITISEESILRYLTSVEDLQIRIILRLRFIRGLSWKEVSALIRYTTEGSVKSACYAYFNKQSARNDEAVRHLA